jgi:acetyl-CoA acetyltransferase
MLSLSGKAAVVGAHESPRRSANGVHPYQIHAECIRAALDDAGLDAGDVDGFCTAAGDWGEGGAASDILDVTDYLGLRPRYFESTDVGGGSYVAHAGHAAMAIALDEAEVVVISYAAVPRWWPSPVTFWDGLTQPAGPGQFEIPYSPTIIASVALLAQRHMHDYGTTSEHLARIAVTCRANAALNPDARYRDPLTVDDVVNSPVIASPLHKFDCCGVTEGGGAVVLTSAERAKDCRKPPVWILGFGEAISSLSLSRLPERLTTPAKQSGDRAFAMAGLGRDDIDTAQLYDAFTSTVAIMLEDLGFCEKGDVGAFLDSGAIDAGGTLPINTDGGGLSSNHPGRRGMFALIEAVRQIRNEGPGTQVPDCRTALVQGAAGNSSAAMTLILGGEGA